MKTHSFIIGAVTLASLLAPAITFAHGKPAEHQHARHVSVSTCARVAPGHFIAPGWLKRHAAPTLSTCQTLPAGILGLMGSSSRDHTDNDDSHSTSTVTHAAPVIGNVAVSQVGSTTATVTWSTDTFSNGAVLFGTTSPVGAGQASATTPIYSLGHVVTLSGLTASTTYFYTIQSTNIFGDVGSTTGGSFTTAH